MKQTSKQGGQDDSALELELIPAQGVSAEPELLDTYDGGFHVTTAPKFDGRVVNKRSGLQNFTC